MYVICVSLLGQFSSRTFLFGKNTKTFAVFNADLSKRLDTLTFMKFLDFVSKQAMSYVTIHSLHILHWQKKMMTGVCHDAQSDWPRHLTGQVVPSRKVDVV